MFMYGRYSRGRWRAEGKRRIRTGSRACCLPFHRLSSSSGYGGEIRGKECLGGAAREGGFDTDRSIDHRVHIHDVHARIYTIGPAAESSTPQNDAATRVGHRPTCGATCFEIPFGAFVSSRASPPRERCKSLLRQVRALSYIADPPERTPLCFTTLRSRTLRGQRVVVCRNSNEKVRAVPVPVAVPADRRRRTRGMGASERPWGRVKANLRMRQCVRISRVRGLGNFVAGLFCVGGPPSGYQKLL